MENNRRTKVWLPFIIAASIAVGIFIGNYYKVLSGKQQGRAFSNGDKISAILGIINEQYVDTVNMNDLIENTIPKIFGELDPHSVYIPAKDLADVNEELDGSFSGIGVSFNMQTDTIMVISVISGGPAEKAGILPFDRIITINDSLFAGTNKSQEKIMKSLRGAKNSTVKLGIKRGLSDELLQINVTRGDVPVKSVDVCFTPAEGIGFIKVSKFGRTTYNEFLTAIAKLKQQGVNSFIIDLRDNTGGFMDAAINMVNEFMPEGKLIVYTEGKSFPRSDVYANGTGTCKDAEIVLESTAKLTDGYIVILVDNNVTGAATGEPVAYNLTSAADASEAPGNATTIFVNCVLDNTQLSSIARKNLIVYQNIKLAADAAVTGDFEVAGNVQIENTATNDKSTEVTLTLNNAATNVVNEGASLKLDKKVKLKGSAAGTTLDVNGGFDMNGGSIDGTTLGIE